ncbi:unnamed protein product [Closterium sp. NIES-64]|nr:unnamed protein product [Closterium sp. NIES-64]
MDLLTGAPMTRGGSGYQRSSMERSMLGESLRERMCPALMVLSTAAAEAACQKNALSFVDLLRPHCEFSNLNVPVRTAGEHSYRLHDFRVRVFYASEIQQPSQEAAEDFCVRFVTNASEAADAELMGADPSDLNSIIGMANAENRTCWFQRFTDELMRTLVFSDHETFDHPIACLLVASTSEPFPVRALRELMTPERLPALYRDGTMDPKLHLHYLLLHDCSSLGPPSTSSQVELTIAEMRAAFGSPVCRLLPINSAAAPSQSRPDIWTKHRPVPVGGVAPPPPAGTALPQSPSGPPVSGAVGQYMSEADVREVADMMMELSVKHLVPHLERKARDLNQQISASRRGLRNQIKNLWFGKGKEESADATPGVYTYRSPESQIRQLADAAMMLQDFQLALDNYRLVAADYRRDKAWKHYAGAQEMVAVSLFLLEISRREMEQCMESAYASYQRCGPLGARFALRTVFWMIGMFKAKGNFRDAALTLMRASLEESGVKAAVLLEQAAVCFVRVTPPMLRKYGFHMVLAGNRYNLASQAEGRGDEKRGNGQKEQKKGRWRSATSNVMQAKLSAYLGSYNGAVVYFVRLLACAHQSAAMQATFLREFLYVVQVGDQGGVLADGAVQSKDKQGALELPLPHVNTQKVYVHFEDHRIFASPASEELPESFWSALEEGVVPPAAAMVVPTWLDAPSKTRAGAHDTIATNTCVAGEDIGVDVEFWNPLQIALQISGVHLLCHHYDTSSSSSSSTTTTTSSGTGTAAANAPSSPASHLGASPAAVPSASPSAAGDLASDAPTSSHSRPTSPNAAAKDGSGLVRAASSPVLDQAESSESLWESSGRDDGSASRKSQSQSDLAADDPALFLHPLADTTTGDEDQGKGSEDDGKRALAKGTEGSNLQQQGSGAANQSALTGGADGRGSKKAGKVEAGKEEKGKEGNMQSASAAAAIAGSGLTEPYVAEKTAFALKPGERVTVRLKVRPCRVGVLHIFGVEWAITSEGRTAVSRSLFDIKAPPKRKGKPSRQLPTHQRLHFHVIPEMPRVQAELEGMPEEAVEGQLYRLQLKLTNTSHVPLKRLKLRTSHPACLLLGDPADRNARLPACLEQQQVDEGEATGGVQGTKRTSGGGGGSGVVAAEGGLPVERSRSVTDPQGDHGSMKNGFIFSFPSRFILEGGASLVWPLWLHPLDTTSLDLGLVVFFEPAHASGAAGTASAAATSVGSILGGVGPGSGAEGGSFPPPLPTHHHSHQSHGHGHGHGHHSHHRPSQHHPSHLSSHAPMTFRTLRLRQTITIHPSLHVSLRIAPSNADIACYLLRMDVENHNHSRTFWLRQVSCPGSHWRLAPLQPAQPRQPSLTSSAADSGSSNLDGQRQQQQESELEDEEQQMSGALLSAALAAPQILPPGQGTSLFFHIQDFASSAKNERADRESFKSDARMGGQAEPLIDIRRDPLHALHLRERVFQALPPPDPVTNPDAPPPKQPLHISLHHSRFNTARPSSVPLSPRGHFTPSRPPSWPTPPGGGGAGGTGSPGIGSRPVWRSGSGGGGGTGGGGSVRGQGGELLDVVLLWEYQEQGPGNGSDGRAAAAGGVAGSASGSDVPSLVLPKSAISSSSKTASSEDDTNASDRNVNRVCIGTHHICNCQVGPAYGVSSVAAATASASTSAGGGGGGTASGAATGAAASAGSGSAADNASAANAGSTAASAAVRWRMDGPSYLQHDFSSNPTCPVSLTLLLRNCSSSPASAAVHTFDPALLPAVEKNVNASTLGSNLPEKSGFYCPNNLDGQDGGTVASPRSFAGGFSGGGGVLGGDEVACGTAACGPYMWAGQTAMQIPKLAPGEETSVKLTALVFSPGVYNFWSYRVAWSADASGGEAGGKTGQSAAAKDSRGKVPAKEAGGKNSSKRGSHTESSKSSREEAQEIAQRLVTGCAMLHTTAGVGAGDDDHVVESVFASRYTSASVPKYHIPKEGIPKEAAYQMIHDELLLDCNPRLNLASFVTTWMEPECDQLVMESLNKNYINIEEYPVTNELQERCVNIIANLYNAPLGDGEGAIGAGCVGSSEAIMLAGLAFKRKWQEKRKAQGLPYDKPNFICGSEVQVCWEKFSNYFEVETKFVNVKEGSFVMDPHDAVEAVDENTICICGILGSTYNGEFEDIKLLNDFLVEKNAKTGWDTPIHVDAASGGFVAPFLWPELEWDFRLPTVRSINVSGHKYGLVYPGVGWVVWRSKADLPEDLIFHVNYLGADQPTFTLNFSKGSSQLIAQYYQFVRLGFEGYRKIIGNCQTNAMYLKKAIEDMGCFEILSKDVGVPLVTFALKEKNSNFNEYDIADVLKQFGWIIPAYTMAPDLEHVTMLRALVREDFSRSLADRFLNDLRMTVKMLEDRGVGMPRTKSTAEAAAAAVASVPEHKPITVEVPKPGSKLARDLAADELYVLSPLAGTRLMPPSKLEHSHSMDSSALRQRTFRVFKKNSIAKTNGVC